MIKGIVSFVDGVYGVIVFETEEAGFWGQTDSFSHFRRGVDGEIVFAEAGKDTPSVIPGDQVILEPDRGEKAKRWGLLSEYQRLQSLPFKGKINNNWWE